MSKLPLRDLKWSRSLTTETPFRSYRVRSEGNGKFAVYYESETGEPATGFTSMFDAMDWAENTHYASEMQPYVVPTATYTMLSKLRPSEDGHYLTLKKGFTYEMGNPNDLVPHVGFWNGGRGCFDEDHNNMLFFAWMPIPEFKQGE